MATEAILLNSAVSAVVFPALSGKKDASQAFEKLVKRLQDDGE